MSYKGLGGLSWGNLKSLKISYSLNRVQYPTSQSIILVGGEDWVSHVYTRLPLSKALNIPFYQHCPSMELLPLRFLRAQP